MLEKTWLFSGCKPANPFLDLEAQVEEDEEDVDSELEGRGSARSCLYALLTTS